MRAFHAIDSIDEEDLLKWESLQLDDIQGNLEPFSLALREIALNGVYSRVIIRKDGTLNLQNLVQKEAKPADSQTPAPATTKPAEQPALAAAQQPPAARKQIRVDAVTIQDGTLAFSDNHLPQHFDTTFYNLGGRGQRFVIRGCEICRCGPARKPRKPLPTPDHRPDQPAA